jgi:hypothetical protein
MSDLIPPMMPDDLDALIQAMERVQQLEAEVARLRLTDAEREAVDRVRIAFRDMDHNDMTMQQIEDYEAICDLLERTQ